MERDKAALYLRLSKEDIDKAGGHHSRSIENQRKLLEAYADSHRLCIEKVYIDDDYSGLYIERPGFENMLADASKQLFHIILAKSQARLSRNMEHAEYLLHDLFPSMGIRFIGVTDGVDTARKEGKKARQINALVNEWYSEDLSESIRAVYRRKMLNGEYMGAYAPYGYRKSSKDSHRLEIDEAAARGVIRIYEGFCMGETIEQICHALEELQIMPPVPYREGREAGGEMYSCKWSASTVKKILSNEVYVGDTVQGKCKRKSFKDKKIVYLPREEWIVVRNTHEAIIERKKFEQVQRMRKKRRKSR